MLFELLDANYSIQVKWLLCKKAHKKFIDLLYKSNFIDFSILFFTVFL